MKNLQDIQNYIIAVMNNQTIFTCIPIEDFTDLISSAIRRELSLFLKASEKPKDEELIKIEAVCKMLNVSKVTVWTWKKTGKIPFYRLGGRIYYKRSEILEAMNKIEGGSALK